MGITKTDLYTSEQNALASALKVLGHPARVAILQFLSSTQSCITGDIVDEIGLAQPTISQHLKELKNANIIQGTIEGTSICYCLNQKTIMLLEEFFGGISNKLNNKCC